MVVSLLTIISVVAIPNFINFHDDAKTKVTQEKLNSIKQAITGDARMISGGKILAIGYINHMGRLPSTLTELVTKGSQATYDPFTKKGWRGPYLNNSEADWNLDAWGTAISYNSGTRTITSCGIDLTCGNADDIQVNF